MQTQEDRNSKITELATQAKQIAEEINKLKCDQPDLTNANLVILEDLVCKEYQANDDDRQHDKQNLGVLLDFIRKHPSY